MGTAVSGLQEHGVSVDVVELHREVRTHTLLTVAVSVLVRVSCSLSVQEEGVVTLVRPQPDRLQT